MTKENAAQKTSSKDTAQKEIIIEPVTRIEGHGKISLLLDESGNVSDAKFHVTQFRGFEKFTEGRPSSEMPSIVERICGICPISHSLAAAKACDSLLGVRIPLAAIKIRKLLNCGSFIESHALSFFHLSSPDLLLGFDSDPAKRNILGLIKSNPSLAKDGIRLRQIGGHIVEWLGKKRVHPAWVVPGGVNDPLTEEHKNMMLAELPEAYDIIKRTLSFFKRQIEKYHEESRTFGNFPSLFLGLVNDEGNWELTDGYLRLIDTKGSIIVDRLDPSKYEDIIAEATEPYSYLKSPYYKQAGYPDGMYRVGPAARLNVCTGMGTHLANEEWAEFRSLERGPVLSAFHNHYARLVEILACVELVEKLLNDPEILSRHIRSFAQPNHWEGIGCVEAPRGTLIHHYKTDENGLMKWANLIVATGHNNLAMNKSVMQVARHFVTGAKITEGMLNRVEAVIRAYDPCLSCSTHALGQMPLHIELRAADGRLLDSKTR